MKKIIFFGGLFFLIINIFFIKESLAAGTSTVKVIVDTSKDYIPGQTYNVTWESECKGGYAGVWFSSNTPASNGFEVVYPLNSFRITPILQGENVMHNFSNGFSFNSVYAMNSNQGTLNWKVPSEVTFSNYSFGGPASTYTIYRINQNGKYTIDERISNQIILVVSSRKYKIRVDIKGKDCTATGESDLFNVVAVDADSTSSAPTVIENQDKGVVNGSEITVTDPTDLSGKNNYILHYFYWADDYKYAANYCQIVKQCTGYKNVTLSDDGKNACRCDNGSFGCSGGSCAVASGAWRRISSLTCTGCPVADKSVPTSSTSATSSQMTPPAGGTPQSVAAPAKTTSSTNKLSKAEAAFIKKQAGKILLQVESKGEAWYVNPKNSQRYYLANGNDAYQIMRTLGIGISNKDMEKIKTDVNFRKKFIGQILLQVESHGEAYYISSNNRYNYLKDGAAAYQAMRSFGLGVTNNDLNKIPVVNSSSASSSSPTTVKLEVGVESACPGNSKCLKYKSVEISWQLDSDSFSEEMQSDGTAAYSGSALDEKDSAEMIKIIKTALDKYPEGLLKRYLNKIYLCGVLSYGSNPMLGTIDKINHRLYLVKNEQKEKVEQALHHELAHLIYFNKNIYLPNFETDWGKINPADFAYKANFIDSVATNDTNAFSQSLGNQGFLSLYAQNNFKEDFAVMAMNMFKQAPLVLKADFWSVVDTYPKVKEKFNLMVNFYHEINAIFTADYFRQISKF